MGSRLNPSAELAYRSCKGYMLAVLRLFVGMTPSLALQGACSSAVEDQQWAGFTWSGTHLRRHVLRRPARCLAQRARNLVLRVAEVAHLNDGQWLAAVQEHVVQLRARVMDRSSDVAGQTNGLNLIGPTRAATFPCISICLDVVNDEAIHVSIRQ